MDTNQINSLGFDIALQRFNEESQRREQIDTKASFLLGFIGLLSGLHINLITGLIASKYYAGHPNTVAFLFTCAIIPLMLSSLLCLVTLWIRDYKGGPGGKILNHIITSESTEYALSKFMMAYTNAYQHNWSLNTKKSNYLSGAFVMLNIGAVLTFFGALFFLWM